MDALVEKLQTFFWAPVHCPCSALSHTNASFIRGSCDARAEVYRASSACDSVGCHQVSVPLQETIHPPAVPALQCAYCVLMAAFCSCETVLCVCVPYTHISSCKNSCAFGVTKCFHRGSYFILIAALWGSPACRACFGGGGTNECGWCPGQGWHAW